MFRKLAILIFVAGMSLPWPALGDSDTERTVIMDRATCRALVRHHPDPGVTYQPGVDIKGRPVVPADLSPQRAFGPLLPEEVVLALPLYGFAPRIRSRGLGRSDVVVGRITLDPQSGDVLFHGRPLDDSQRQKVAVLCRRL